MKQSALVIGAALVGAVLCAAALAAGRQLTSAERLQRLEDLHEINQLLLDYGRHLDARDFVAYSNLFAKDRGEWIGGFGRARGPEAILALMREKMPERGGPRGIHLITNESIRLDGDRATAVSKWAFVMPAENRRPAIVYLGHYDDTLIRENGQWKFLQRIAYGDIPFGDPLAAERGDSR